MKKTKEAHGPRKAMIRSFLLAFVPMSLLILGLGLWSAQKLFEKNLAKAQSDQAAVLNTRTAIITEDIDNGLEKLLAILNDPNLMPALTVETLVTRKRLEESFVTLCLRNRGFDMVRWIDETGMEIVRVDRLDGKVAPVAANALQDKSQRDYFRESMRLPPGKIYISPLDLSVEHGRIEMPFKPTLRIATPVQDARTRRPRGIVIVNMNAAALLDKLPRQHFTGSQLMWLDEAGYWLRAPDPNDEWAFQRGRADTFASRHPDVWLEMALSNQTHFSNAGGLWRWDVLDPRSAEGLGAMVAQSPRWRLVSLMPAVTLHELSFDTLTQIAPPLLVSLLLLAGVTFLQARRGEQLNQREQEQTLFLARLHKIASRLPGFIYEYRLDPNGRSCFPFASEAIREIYRMTPEEVREDASRVFAILHPEDLARVRASIQTSADTLTLWHEEYRVHFADGTVRWLSGNALPQRQADGSVLWHGFINDITDRKDHLLALGSLTERLRATVNSALDCIIVLDRDGRIVEFNPASEHCFGYRRQDVIGRILAEMIVPEKHREAHRRGLQHYLETGEGPVLRKRIEIEALRKDGSEFPVELAIDVARSPNEELFVAYLRDITERKQAEVELSRSQEELSKLGLLAARTDNAVVFTDAEGRIEWVNDGFTRLSGWRAALKEYYDIFD